ncbi:hypothetical protein XENOCAPTIV_030166 [Xenoophorus captivus]|uniref:Uncharacterized protein n=1 Tax=Xenoophorus captivus TaxID=1517983 RepID=A0ABV0RLV9_9TELE
MFSVSYDYHKVSLGSWSSQTAAGEATSPLSHEMTWHEARRMTHNIESMMLRLHTHTDAQNPKENVDTTPTRVVPRSISETAQVQCKNNLCIIDLVSSFYVLRFLF